MKKVCWAFTASKIRTELFLPNGIGDFSQRTMHFGEEWSRIIMSLLIIEILPAIVPLRLPKGLGEILTSTNHWFRKELRIRWARVLSLSFGKMFGLKISLYAVLILYFLLYTTGNLILLKSSGPIWKEHYHKKIKFFPEQLALMP